MSLTHCGRSPGSPSLGFSTVTNTGFLVNASTVITPIAAWVLLRHRPGVMVWPAVGLTLLGAFMMSGETFTRFNPGDALALASAVFYSLWMIYLGVYVMRYGQAGLLTLVQFAATDGICLAIGLVIEPISAEGLWRAVPELLMLGLLSTGVAYCLQAMAQTHTSASEAAVIVSGEAVFGAICAFILLGESLDSHGLIGAVLILSGIAVVQINHSAVFAKWKRAA